MPAPMYLLTLPSLSLLGRGSRVSSRHGAILSPEPFVSHATLGLRLTSSEGSAPRDVSCNPVGGKMTEFIIGNILALLVLTRLLLFTVGAFCPHGIGGRGQRRRWDPRLGFP